MPAPALLLPTSGNHLSVRVHPVVLFTICDAYIRRNEKQDRVIGTLLGTVADNTVDIKNCFVVPHNESPDQVMLDIAHHKTMFELQQRVAPSEGILGWFATGPHLYKVSDALIQDFYSKEAPNSVHLLVDTTLSEKKFSIQAFMSRQLTLGDKVLGTEFVEVPCEVLFNDAERVGVDLLSGGSASARPMTDSESLQASLKRLQGLMDQVLVHVEDVLAGRKPGNPAIGRYLADALAVVPHLTRSDFEKLFNDNVQDVMLVMYLSNLLRTQVALAEKLGTGQLPIV